MSDRKKLFREMFERVKRGEELTNDEYDLIGSALTFGGRDVMEAAIEIIEENYAATQLVKEALGEKDN